MSGLFLCVQYLLPVPDTGYRLHVAFLLFKKIVFRFVFVFLFVLSCVLFGGESLLPCAPRAVSYTHLTLPTNREV